MKNRLHPPFFWSLVGGIFLLLILILVGSLFGGHRASKTPFSEVARAVEQAAVDETMQEGNAQILRRLYGLQAEDYDGVFFYYPSDNMRVEELLLIRVKSPDQKEDLLARMKERIATQRNSFDGYGVEQCALLDASVLEERGNDFLLCVSAKADDARRAFLHAM